MNIHIATIFDKNYLVRTLAFYRAFNKNHPGAKFWFLCLDKETKEVILKVNIQNIVLMTLEELGDQELLDTRDGRSPAEFAFTAKSAWMNYIMKNLKDGEIFIYADNDIIYFSNTDRVIQDMKDKRKSIGIVPHRFSKDSVEKNETIGKYNAGLVYFIADKNSRLCISEWRAQCIDWCYLRYEKDRFGDQLYMNVWPSKYSGVYEIPDKGINVGSWSLGSFRVGQFGDKFMIDEEPLICYHFHRIRFFIDGKKLEPMPIYVYHNKLYEVYRAMLEEAWQSLEEVTGKWIYGFVEQPTLPREIKQKIHRFFRNLIFY